MKNKRFPLLRFVAVLDEEAIDANGEDTDDNTGNGDDGGDKEDKMEEGEEEDFNVVIISNTSNHNLGNFTGRAS